MIAKIESLGYKVVDHSGLYEGKFADRRYHLVSPQGTTLDNGGQGYATLSDAYSVAKVLSSGEDAAPGS